MGIDRLVVPWPPAPGKCHGTNRRQDACDHALARPRPPRSATVKALPDSLTR